MALNENGLILTVAQPQRLRHLMTALAATFCAATRLTATSYGSLALCHASLPFFACSCKQCGGPGCQDRPGGAAACCAKPIQFRDLPCTHNDAPCVIDKCGADNKG